MTLSDEFARPLLRSSSVLKIGTIASHRRRRPAGITSPSSSLCAMIIAPISRVLTPQLVV